MNAKTPNLEEILTFVEVGRHMSLSAAASALRVSIATVSRRISRLEERLDVQLLYRNTRGVTLTEAGTHYIERATRGLELIMSAEEELQDIMDMPRGRLRVAAPAILLQHTVGDVAIEYARAYPGVELHMLEVNHDIDMDEMDLDVAIQVLPSSKWALQGVRSTKSLARKSLGHMEMALCASPAYLEECGPIEAPSDLAGHECVVLGANPSARLVRFMSDDEDAFLVEVGLGIFTTNVSFCRNAALAGLGPAGMTMMDCARWIERGELVRILEEWRLEPVWCVATFVEEQRTPRRIRAFLDLLGAFFEERYG